jgi:hypothetical protein
MSQHDILGAVQIQADSYNADNPHHSVHEHQDENGETVYTYMDNRYHVNALSPIEGADDFKIQPNPHSRVFSGVPIEQHLFYRFVDEAQYREFVPAVEVE